MNCNSRNKLFKQLSLPIKNELFDSITKFSTQINTLPNIFGIKKWNENYNRAMDTIIPKIPIIKIPAIKFPPIELINPITDYAKQYSQLFDSFKTQWEQIIECINVSYPENLKLLAKHGWYIELDTDKSLAHIIAIDFNDGYSDIAEELMLDYYIKSADRIFKDLCKRHSKRASILTEIKKLYDLELYNSSIMCLLSQIDGVCFDKVDQLFFIRDKDKYLPKMVKPLSELQDEFLKMFLSPLLESCPIFAGEEHLNHFPCKLNRHRILHGKDLEFGQKSNFLKCLSLLKYISDLLRLIEREKENGNNV